MTRLRMHSPSHLGYSPLCVQRVCFVSSSLVISAPFWHENESDIILGINFNLPRFMYFKSESKQKAKSIIISIFCVIYYKLFGHITLPISEMQRHSWDWVVISLWGICPEGIESRNMPSCLRHIWALLYYMNPRVFVYIYCLLSADWGPAGWIWPIMGLSCYAVS